MKECAFCAEPIQDKATVCPHCRRNQPIIPIGTQKLLIMAVALLAAFGVCIYVILTTPV